MKKNRSIYKRNYYRKHKVKLLKQKSIYYQINKQYILNFMKKYYKKHKQRIMKVQQKYYDNRFEKDPIFKLRIRLRHRLNDAIARNFKSGSAVRDLGCSIKFFKTYIESKFYSNMTWDNYGDYWQLDHIKPLFTFDLTDRNQFVEAVNYTNLQPLTIEDHGVKTTLERKLV